MFYSISVLGFLISVAGAVPLSSGATRPLVDLGYSTYQGETLDAGVNQYLGMRFAAPPLGDLRWRAPADPTHTVGVQDATEFGPICFSIGADFPSDTESEDCLFINVWTPSDATPESKLPVWFFIQGGGYVANSNPNYNGTDVVLQSGGNLVLVNFNYRVAAWGFLASEKVRENGDLNAGLLDERKALQWVQKYISKFGGDPDHVVIHGDSAGAGSVAIHLTAYGGRNDGLFVGGIGESVFFPAQPKVPELEWQFRRFVHDAGCGGAYDELECLRSKDTATIQAANVASPFPGRETSPLFYFTPTIDGDLIQDYPYNMFKQGKFIHVPIIFGDDTDEGTDFAANATSPAEVASFLKDNFPRLSSEDTHIINKLYPKMPPVPTRPAYFPSAAAAFGEATFTCPGNFIIEVFSKYADPQKVWNYRVNVIDATEESEGFGVPHTFEMPAVFGVGFAGGEDTSFATYNAAIVPVIMHYWISFIIDLNPNRLKAPGAPEWLPFTSNARRIKLQTNDTVMEEVPKAQKDRCEFWYGIGAKLEQ